jgi:hypothetical protein
MRILQNGWAFTLLAASLTLCTSAFADINTVNDGPIVAGGNYFNTPGSKTTFKNSSGGGLWLKSGSNVRGVEVNSAGTPTNNGGTIHFYAPGNVVRLDGNIDVRGIRNQSGAYLGNGGKVFVDSAYLYQSGNIYANGFNGGQVQFNVGSATLSGTARIEAKGIGGLGGKIGIQASDTVALGQQTVLDSSGKVAGFIDANLINIQGAAVNLSGLLQANGIASNGGTIIVKSTQGDVTIATGNTPGTPAKLIANGGHIPSNQTGEFPSSQKAGDGGNIRVSAQRSIHNGGWLLVNGGSGAPNNIVDPRDTRDVSDGGNGGSIQLVAGHQIENTGRIASDGGIAGIYNFSHYAYNGGSGGLISLKAGSAIQNTGVIRAIGANASHPANTDQPNIGASGGDGGKVIFQSSGNPPEGNGVVATFGGNPTFSGSPTDPYSPVIHGAYGKLGSITAPNPAASTNQLYGVWLKSP